MSPSKHDTFTRKENIRRFFKDEAIRDFSFVLQCIRNPIYDKKQLPILVPTTIFFNRGKPYLMVENTTEIWNGYADNRFKDGFNPEEATMGGLQYEEKLAKIRISEFRRIFGERSRQIYPTPYLKSNPPKFPNVKRLKNFKWINTPCIDLSIFKDHM